MLKMLPARVLKNQQLKDRFFEEAQIMAKFNHPNIATVYSFGEHEGSPYLALEFLEGWTLKELMRQKKFSIPESMRIGLAIARALSKMHGCGVMHRDLKPGNIMVLHNGALRLKDFGFAEVTHMLLAAAADIWALGSILCLLLGGVPPYFTGLKEVPADVESLVAHCLDKDPWKRPSAAEVAARLCSQLCNNPETTEKEGADEFWHSICYLPLAAL
jgi:serine/threonine protein kinase